MTLQSEHKWLATHSKAVELFSGKWVAILDGKVVASGANYADVWNSVKSTYPQKVPLVTYVLKPGEEQLIA